MKRSTELQRIVEFLNGQMERAEVLAVEIKPFSGRGNRTLVPRVLGRTAEAQRAKGVESTKRQWDEATLFEALAKRVDETSVGVARRLLDWSRERTTI